MNDVTRCEVCGRNLSAMSKSSTCSAKCRKRKSRLGLDAGKNAMAARNALRYLEQGLNLDVVDTADMYEEWTEIVAVVNKVREAYNARFERERAAAANLPES